MDCGKKEAVDLVCWRSPGQVRAMANALTQLVLQPQLGGPRRDGVWAVCTCRQFNAVITLSRNGASQLGVIPNDISLRGSKIPGNFPCFSTLGYQFWQRRPSQQDMTIMTISNSGTIPLSSWTVFALLRRQIQPSAHPRTA